MTKTFYAFLLNFLVTFIGLAQSPTDLTSDVSLPNSVTYTYFAPHGFFSNQTQVINAFNFARRTEETQLGLPVNSLGNLSLPASYASASPQERALFLINAELWPVPV